MCVQEPCVYLIHAASTVIQNIYPQLAGEGVPHRGAELPASVGGDFLRDSKPGNPAVDQGVGAARRQSRTKRNRFCRLCQAVHHCEQVGVAVRRRRERAYQVNVNMAESLGGVGNVARRSRRLRRDLGPLALLTVSAPGCHLGGQAQPYETA